MRTLHQWMVDKEYGKILSGELQIFIDYEGCDFPVLPQAEIGFLIEYLVTEANIDYERCLSIEHENGKWDSIQTYRNKLLDEIKELNGGKLE